MSIYSAVRRKQALSVGFIVTLKLRKLYSLCENSCGSSVSQEDSVLKLKFACIGSGEIKALKVKYYWCRKRSFLRRCTFDNCSSANRILYVEKAWL